MTIIKHRFCVFYEFIHWFCSNPCFVLLLSTLWSSNNFVQSVPYRTTASGVMMIAASSSPFGSNIRNSESTKPSGYQSSGNRNNGGWSSISSSGSKSLSHGSSPSGYGSSSSNYGPSSVTMMKGGMSSNYGTGSLPSSNGFANGQSRIPSSYGSAFDKFDNNANSGMYSSMTGNNGQPIPAAVQSKHKVKFVHVPTTFEGQPTTIEVSSRAVPINILLKSTSSWLNVEQIHQGSMGSYQESKSEDQPHTLKHVVTKPVIQELHEMITPYRFITQEVKPVNQVIETIVARGHDRMANGVMGQHYSPSPSSTPPAPAVQLKSFNQNKSSNMSSMADPYQIDHESFYGIEQRHIDLEPMTAYSEQKEQWMNELIGQQQTRYEQAIAKALLSTVYGIPALASPKSF